MNMSDAILDLLITPCVSEGFSIRLNSNDYTFKNGKHIGEGVYYFETRESAAEAVISAASEKYIKGQASARCDNADAISLNGVA